MARIPGRYKRLVAAFEEGAKAAPPPLGESSGSEHSAAASVDLSDLIVCFIERQNKVIGEIEHEEMDLEKEQEESESDSEMKVTMLGLLGCGEDEIRQNILAETEEALRGLGNDSSSPDFKRRLMAQLRERGFDAGLCKSKWERNGRLPPGSYEYIDVNVSGIRNIVEVCLASQFEIARSTTKFASILELFPPVFVGKVEDLKQIVKLMCTAVKKSMKSMQMHVPPWRQYGYMQSKWLGSYKRTTNEVSVKKEPELIGDEGARKRFVGFAPFPVASRNCREVLAGKGSGVKLGQLAMIMNE